MGVDAKALFERHYKTFIELDVVKSGWGNNIVRPDIIRMEVWAILMGACILAEAIRNDMDEFEIKKKGE